MARNILMNSAMMPDSGTYKCKYVDERTFVKAFKKVYEKTKTFESTIGYESTAKHLSNILGIEVPMNRTNTSLLSGDVMWVIRQSQRSVDPAMKGTEIPTDFVYAIIEFK